VDLSDAALQGWRDAVLARASDHRIYATIDALDLAFPRSDPNATAAQLWMAQVNYWITRDIVEAIRKTNEDVLKDLPEGERSIPNAAVKQLLEIRVADDYYMGGALSLTGTGRAGGGRPGPRGVQFGGYEGAYMEEGPAGGRAPVAREPAVAGETLTGRVSNPEYDVVHYAFTVILPLRHLDLLETNLMADKLHAVLDEEMAAASEAEPASGTDARAGARGRTAGDASAGMPGRHYGTEPVMKVTIYGEFLMLTNWARELMPIQVLLEQFGRQSPALRPEDRQRLPAAAPVPTGRR
jgi:hypothetical protein